MSKLLIDNLADEIGMQIEDCCWNQGSEVFRCDHSVKDECWQLVKEKIAEVALTSVLSQMHADRRQGSLWQESIESIARENGVELDKTPVK